VIVENRTGANGNVAAEYVSKSAADGYTVMLGDIGALSIAPSVYPTLPFDPVKDFSPVVMVSYSPHILAVHPSVPVSNVKELIAYAKARPGQLNFAVSGTGGAPHLAGIEFQQTHWRAMDLHSLQRRLAGRARRGGRQANILFNGMLATYGQVKNGKLKALGVSSARRVAAAPICRRLPTRPARLRNRVLAGRRRGKPARRGNRPRN